MTDRLFIWKCPACGWVKDQDEIWHNWRKECEAVELERIEVVEASREEEVERELSAALTSLTQAVDEIAALEAEDKRLRECGDALAENLEQLMAATNPQTHPRGQCNICDKRRELIVSARAALPDQPTEQSDG